MVGGGRTSRNWGTPTAPKETPRGRGRPPSASKRKRAIDFIEISSSNNVSVEDNGETKHVSPMNVHKNDKSSLRSNVDNNSDSKMDQQLALGLGAPYEPPKALMDFYKKDFMGTVEVLRKVLPKSRMRIVIDLVLSPYNKKKEEVVPKAVQNWEDLKTKRKNLVKKGLED
ncbi:hypothetical protein RIF29_29550 [Crotalaria pallida]|uniref:Uncharacterized protein n=1 Tax=Crotalaria pallida TaxID=3830 RepID=A0AAN9EF27_CROPI